MGNFKKDALQGCYGIVGLMDNRVLPDIGSTPDTRCLTLGSASVNYALKANKHLTLTWIVLDHKSQ